MQAQQPAEVRVALRAFSDAMGRLYGERLVDILLYGSRARGDAAEGSDVDLLVVLAGEIDFWPEFDRIAPFASSVSLEHDVLLSVLPVSEESLRRGATPLLRNAGRDAVSVV